MVWTTLSFPFGSVLTSAKMTQLYDNLTALANGDSGAPNIQTAAYAAGSVDQAAIGANDVGQSELKTTTANQSSSVAQNAVGTITPTGATYTLAYWLSGATATYTPAWDRTTWGSVSAVMLVGHNAQSSATIRLAHHNGAALTCYVYSRYVQASPPWNLGNGDVGLFVFALRHKKTGEILGTYAAQDPPWAYRGPHDLHPVMGRLKKAVGLWGLDIKQTIRGGPSEDFERVQQGLLDIKEIMDYGNVKRTVDGLDFTMEEKMCDCAVIPQPFAEYDPSIHEVLLVDPCSDMCDRLAMLHMLGGEDAYDASTEINEGNIILGDRVGAKAPNGVIPVSARWR